MLISSYAIFLSTSPTLIVILIILFSLDIQSCMYMLSYFLEDEWIFVKWFTCLFLAAEDVLKSTPTITEMDNSDNAHNKFDPSFSSASLLVMLDAVLLESDKRSRALVKICDQIKDELVQ